MEIKNCFWYLGKLVVFRQQVDSEDEAQALLDYNRSQGRVSCCTHYNGKHQVYSENKREVKHE